MADKLQVIFKRGTSENLEALKATNRIQEGTFYLTTDTNRLYVGRKDINNKIIADELNKTIQEIDTFESLGAATATNLNQFYYCIGENILAYCRKNGDSYNWVQINPDTNDTVEVSKFEASAATNNTDSIDIALTLGQTKYTKYGNAKENSPISDKTATVSIPKSMIQGSITVKGAEVALNASAKTDGVQITNTGTGSKSHYIDFVGSKDSSIGFTAADSSNADAHDVITISSPTVSAIATHSATEASIEVKKDDDILAKLKLIPGAKINFAPDPESNSTSVKIEHETITKATGTADNTHPATVVSGITTDGYGHITGFNTSDLTQDPNLGASYTLFSKDTEGKQAQTRYLGNKQLIIDLQKNGNSVHTPIADATITFNDLITTDELKETLKTALAGTDCMVYRGPVKRNVLNGVSLTGDINLPTENVKNGDTYLVEADGKFGPADSEQEAKKGDLFIAIVTKNNEGKITAITWNLIPSGDQIDTTYSVKVSGKTIELDEKAGAAGSENGIGSTTFDNGAVLTAIVSSDDAKNATVKYEHNTVTNQSLGTVPPKAEEVAVFSNDITLVSEVTADTYGHVSKTVYKKIKFVAPNEIYVHLNSVNNDKKITSLMDKGGNARGSIKIDSNTNSGIVVSMTGSSTKENAAEGVKDTCDLSYSIGFEWGEF